MANAFDDLVPPSAAVVPPPPAIRTNAFDDLVPPKVNAFDDLVPPTGGSSAASPTVEGPQGSAVPEGTPATVVSAPRPVTKSGASTTELALRAMPPGFKLLSDATGLTRTANTVETALTSPDTPEQAAARKRIRSSAGAVDESSLLGDLKTSMQSFSEGQIAFDLMSIDKRIANEKAHPTIASVMRSTGLWNKNIEELEADKAVLLKELAAKRKEPRSPENPTYKALNMEENSDAVSALKNTITALGSDPWGVLRSVSAQSGMASVPPIVGGITGAVVAGPPGAAVGAGLGSFSSEYGSDIIEGLEHFGANMGDETSIAETLRLYGPEISRRAAKKAAVVAFMDAAVGGVQGRIAQIPVRGLGRRVAQVAAGSLVDSIGGMAGEAGGQIAQDGGISDYNAVFQEALGEVVPGAITETGQIVGNRLLRKNLFQMQMPTEEELKALWEESNPTEPVSTYREAFNVGRNLYGFAEEGKPTVVGSYEEAEGLMGQGDPRRGKLIAITPDQATQQEPEFSADVLAEMIANSPNDASVDASIIEKMPELAPKVSFIRDAYHSDLELDGEVSAKRQLIARLQLFVKPKTVYVGSPHGLGITPREDNYLHGTKLQSTEQGKSVLWGFKGKDSLSTGLRVNTGNALDLDTLRDSLEEHNLLIIPGGIARRIEGNPDFAQVVDQTFNFSSPDARTQLLTISDPDVIRDLFTTGQVTWKGRYDPRVLTGGIYTLYSGFQVVDQAGDPVNQEFLREEIFRPNLREHVTRPDIDREYLYNKYPRSPLIAQSELDEHAEMRKSSEDVIAFGAHPQLQQFKQYLERLRKLGGIKAKFVLVIAQQQNGLKGTFEVPGLRAAFPYLAQDVANAMSTYPAKNGYFSVAAPDIFTIGITDSMDPNSPFKWSDSELLHTIAHEFGHGMVAAKLINAPLTTVLKIYSAYRRHRAAFDNNHSDGRSREITQPNQWEARQKSPFHEPGGSPYYYGATLEEWAAEQVTRWAVTDEVPMGAVTKFFKNLAVQMKKVLANLAGKGIDVRAEPEFEDWLRSIREGETSAAYAAQIEEYRNIASTHVNSRVDSDPTPAHENSADLYAVLDAYGPQQKPFMSSNHKSAVTNAKVTKAVVDKYNWFYKWAANLRQLAEANPHITELQVARELFAFAKMESSKIMVSADTTLQMWRKLGDKRGRALSAFLFDLNEMNYLSDTERQAGVMRWPTQQEFMDLANQYQLDKESLAVYREVRDFFLETVKREEELKLVDADKIQDPKLKAEAIAAAKKTSVTLVSKPYFPQSRFGKYTLTVRSKVNNKIEHFELFETKREAKVAAYSATKMWDQNDFSIVQSELREDVQQFTGMSPWMLDKIRNMPGLTKDQLLWIDELRYQIAPSQSFTKHMMKRKKYTGFSTDGRRTFAAYAFHHARNYPRVKYAESFREAIKSLDMSLPPGYSPLERAKRKPMADMLQHQVNEFMNPSQDWAQLRALNAIWHLGFNAKSAVVNMTQVFFSAAFLGTKFGGAKAERSILAAGAKLNTFYRKGAYAKATDAEFRAIDRAMKDGHIDESMAAELAALAVGGGMGTRIGKSFIGDKFLHGYIGFTEKAMWMFRMAEQWQRRVVFRAAWQLAVDNPSNIWVNSQAQKSPQLYAKLQKEGWSAREALAYLAGVDALQSTIGVYDRDSRARYAQGRKSVLFAFQSFTQQMLWTLWNNKDMWARYLLYYTVIGGSMGIIPDDMKGLITLLGRKLFGDQFNLERSTREFITEMLGSDSKIPPDLLLHGTARYGFGVPMVMQTLGAKFVPDVDLSPSITLNRLLPVDLGKINMPGARFHDVLATQVEAASGAAYGIPIAIWKSLAATDMDVTDFKRWEGAMPSAARNVSKAFRYGFGQGERDKNFATTVGFDGEDPEQLGEIIAVALGFRPTRMAQQYDRQAAAREIDEFWSVRKQMLMRQAYRDKFVYKDVDAYKETLRQIQAYNKEVFDKKYLITREGLMESMRNRARATTKTETGQNEPPNLRSAMDRMFPETVEEKPVR